MMFKIAIRCNDIEAASECLQLINKFSHDDPNLLYACVLESQKAQETALSLTALQLVLEKYEHNEPPGVHLPALLRCTIRMLLKQVDSPEVDGEAALQNLINQICKTFDAAAIYARKPNASDNGMRLLNELEWFSKNAYNLALKYSLEWPPRDTCTLLNVCMTFTDLYDFDQQSTNDVYLRHIFCDYLAAILLATMARSEDNIEVQLQDYLMVRKHAKHYEEILREKLKQLDHVSLNDLNNKRRCLMALDFEAAVRLKAWEDLMVIVTESESCQDMRILEIFADCLLSGEVPYNGEHRLISAVHTRLTNRSNDSKTKTHREHSLETRRFQHIQTFPLHARSLPASHSTRRHSRRHPR